MTTLKYGKDSVTSQVTVQPVILLVLGGMDGGTITPTSQRFSAGIYCFIGDA